MDGTYRITMFTLDTFYQSKQWIKLRAQLMIERADDNGVIICAKCGRPIVRAYDCVAHHTIELTEENVNDYTISLNPELIQLIHFRCHNEIHLRYNGYKGCKRNVYIVHGAPCSGKSTFVFDNAFTDDLIVDIDKLYAAISNCSMHEQPGRIKSNVFGVRDCIIDQIKCRVGNWRNAWIISSKCALDLERMRDMLRAELIHIDTDEKTCLQNLNNDPGGRDVEKWAGYIKDYFERVSAAGE